MAKQIGLQLFLKEIVAVPASLQGTKAASLVSS